MREQLLKALDTYPDPLPSEVAALCNEGSVFMQLLASIQRYNREATLGLLSLDFVTDEGRLRAIEAQGRAKGREEVFSIMIDLITEGQDKDEHGNADSE